MTIDFSTTVAADPITAFLEPEAVYLELGITTPTDAQAAIVASAILKAVGSIKRHLKYDPIQSSRTEFYPNMSMNLSSREGIWEVNDTQAYIRQMSEVASDELQIRGLPIRSVTSLYIDYDGRAGTKDGAFAVATLKVEGTDFWCNYNMLDSASAKVCTDGIIRSFGRWPSEPGSVKITYVAGYTEEELAGEDSVIDASPIYFAALEEAVRHARRVLVKINSRIGHVAGPLTSERLGDYSYTMDASTIKAEMGMGWDLMGSSVQKLSDFVNYGFQIAS